MTQDHRDRSVKPSFRTRALVTPANRGSCLTVARRNVRTTIWLPHAREMPISDFSFDLNERIF